MVELERPEKPPQPAPPKFVPAMLSTVSEPVAGGGLRVEAIDVTYPLARAMGLELFEQFSHAEVRRPPPIQSVELWTGDGELAATIEDVRASVTRLTNPTPTAARPYNFVVLGFSYYITSHGFKTSLVPVGVPVSGVVPNPRPYHLLEVRFHGPQGIPVYTWWLHFRLDCGWNKNYEYFGSTQDEIVPWATVWTGEWSFDIGCMLDSC